MIEVRITESMDDNFIFDKMDWIQNYINTTHSSTSIDIHAFREADIIYIAGYTFEKYGRNGKPDYDADIKMLMDGGIRNRMGLIFEFDNPSEAMLFKLKYAN